MKLEGSRRLTGPNILWNKCGAVIDVTFTNEDQGVIDLWSANALNLMDAIGWQDEGITIRRYNDGASLAISAPLDVLYTATEVNEWCWQAAEKEFADSQSCSINGAIEQFKSAINEECSPRILEIQAFAQQYDIPFLTDPDEVSLGYGQSSQTWPVGDLPDPASLNSEDFKAIPVGLITGTNGKTTSTRLSSHIVRAAGLSSGISSTDWIAVNGEIIDKGDYSGPSGARTVLRDQRVDVAILETARGGLLRRGLGVVHANAALITNVAEDHMGEFGVQTLEQLADVKWIVSRVLTDSDHLILNADDPLLVSRASQLNRPIIWFSDNPENPQVKTHIESGKNACTVELDQIVLYVEGVRNQLLSISDIPITLGGAATHNVQNALGAVSLTYALGIGFNDIINGLMSFSNADNPGRCNQYMINDARVIVDFAHNPHGMKAFMSVARNLSANRKLLVNGQAGDRSNDDIRELARESAQGVVFDRVIIKFMRSYDRGRKSGEAAEILKDEYIQLGVNELNVSLVETEMEAVDEALQWAQPGDLLILLVHENRQLILDYLAQQEAQTSSCAIN